VVAAEELGFSSVFLVEHHFTGFGQISATLNFLTYLAAKTSRIRLGTAVLVLPWHNPALLAEQAATLDLLSKGRLDLGIGKGYRWGEFHGFCMPMEEAGARFDESIEVIVKAPTAARKFQPGQFYRLQNYERTAPVVEGTRLMMEGLALTGAWVDPDEGQDAVDEESDATLPEGSSDALLDPHQANGDDGAVLGERVMPGL